MAYIGTSPSNGVRRVLTYTATANQTTFTGTSSEGITLTYSDGNYVDVYQNGVLLGTADYTATSGTSIVLVQGASVNDIIVIIVYDVFSVADTVSQSAGGTFEGNVTMAGTLGVTGAITGTLATAAQANITSVGTLTSFRSTGIDDNADALAITINSSENVGIGTTNPASKIHASGAYPQVQVDDAASRNFALGVTSSSFRIRDVTGSADRLKIDAGGVLTANYGVVFNEDSADVDFRVESNNNAFMLVVDASTDNVLIGTGTVRNGGLLSIDFNSAADGGIGINDTASGNGAVFIGFLTGGTFRGSITNNNNSAVAYNTTSDYRLKENVSYSFDATTRLKQLKPARFNWIADSDNTVVDGFLAHEVSSIVPEAITGDKDETKTTENVVLDVHENIIGSDVTEVDWLKGKVEGVYDSNSTWRSTITQKHYQQIDQSKLVPLLVKTIQELEARITALENK